MTQSYNYWKTKRHVIAFASVVTCNLLFLIFIFLGAWDILRHEQAIGTADPEFVSDFILPAALFFVFSFFTDIWFAVDMSFFINVRRRMRKKSGNNVEIRTIDNNNNDASKAMEKRFLNNGIIADVNNNEASNELDIEYAYQIDVASAFKEPFTLVFYLTWRLFLFAFLIGNALCIAMWALINFGQWENAIGFLITSIIVSLLFIGLCYLVMFITVMRAKKRNMKETKEVGFRIFADHIEQYSITEKNGALAEIRHKVAFKPGMKYFETEKHFFFREMKNGQIVGIMLRKSDMPEEAKVLLEKKIEDNR